MYQNLLDRGFFKNKPECLEPNISGLEFYMEAFHELSTSRQIGLGVGAIPFTAIVEYFRMYELSDFDEFAYIIRRIDGAFLEMNAAETDPKNKTEAGGNGAADNRNKKNPHQGGHKRQQGASRDRQ